MDEFVARMLYKGDYQDIQTLIVRDQEALNQALAAGWSKDVPKTWGQIAPPELEPASDAIDPAPVEDAPKPKKSRKK